MENNDNNMDTGFLVLTRHRGERIVLQIDDIFIIAEIREIGGNQVKLSIKAPRSVSIDREEIFLKKLYDKQNGIEYKKTE